LIHLGGDIEVGDGLADTDVAATGAGTIFKKKPSAIIIKKR